MKDLRTLLASALVVFAVSSSAIATECETVGVEAYAHPTLFGSSSQEVVATNSIYVTGGKVVKCENQLAVTNKDRVLIDSWVNDVLSVIRANQALIGGFDEKMPVLRSQLAVILSEGFNLTNTAVSHSYSDVTSEYWAKNWIYGALNAGVMIGYPDKTFKPDQPVTKAEVFATIAQLIDVPTDKSLIVPEYKGKELQYIPNWAIAPTKEVVASQLLESVPNPDKVNNDEYLSTEQVAYLVGALRTNWAGKNSIGRDSSASDSIKAYGQNAVSVKIEDRLSARVANVGDKFSAKTTTDVVVNGQCFKAGSVLKGEVVEVVRPGVNNQGLLKIKFTELKDGDVTVEIPKNIAEAQVIATKNPNFVARLVGAPLSAAGRVVGIAGRTAAAAVNVAGNGLEEFGDETSNVFVDSLSLQPVGGVKNVGNAVVTVGKGVYNLGKLAVSGTYGVIYETLDEIRYVVAPQYSNSSSLNPGEELKILF